MSRFLFILCLLYNSCAFSEVTRKEFSIVKEALHRAFRTLKTSETEVLYINRLIPGLDKDYWWKVPGEDASYVRTESEIRVEHNIYLMGGLARSSEISVEGLALIGCHELGHGLAGHPRKEGSLSSTEGQSDYFATKICLPIVLKNISTHTKFKVRPIYKELCSLQREHEQNLCYRMFFALESEIYIFKLKDPEVKLAAHSEEVSLNLNLSPYYYPEPQCRLDTMINGILNLGRPECWFPNGAKNGQGRI